MNVVMIIPMLHGKQSLGIVWIGKGRCGMMALHLAVAVVMLLCVMVMTTTTCFTSIGGGVALATAFSPLMTIYMVGITVLY